MNDIDLVRALSAISDADADRLISEDARADLAYRITAMPAGKRAHQAAPRARSAIRRRWLIGTPIAMGLAAALLVAMLIGRPAAGSDRSRLARSRRRLLCLPGTATTSTSGCAIPSPTRGATAPSSGRTAWTSR